jgi:thioesterase domain-containing protein
MTSGSLEQSVESFPASEPSRERRLSAPPPFSPFILLKPGVEQPPVFIVHGLGSSVMEFSELIKSMRTDRAIYGLQAKGSDGTNPPLTCIEDMAQFHLDAIGSVQLLGPYTLIGYSLGGLVAFEMARELVAKGEKIASLTMIDSYPNTESLSRWNVIQLAAAQLKYRVSDLMQLSAYRRIRVPLNRIRQRARFSDFLAWTRYRPRFYDGEIKFIRAASSHYPAPAQIWGRLATDLEIESTPGDHHTVLSTHSADLASLLNRHLRSRL